ncbi:hypothetical protein ColLi_13092 [Colletotrichum liriopes]|uniref:Ankyrin repeat protein n=1 Tax=Colletotrichum liriopes TaxID=708192 RepID=A0AA37GZK0_9PEZI|nr:hypothetical protein ColLi_13092 [Colletotrichum liriopes]
MPRNLPTEILLAIFHAVTDIPTLHATTQTSRAAYDAVWPRLYTLALDADDLKLDTGSVQGPDNDLPLALWLAAQQRDVTRQLGRIRLLRRNHLWSRFRIDGSICRPHWPWADRDVSCGYAMPIHMACSHGTLDTVSWLLDQKPAEADIDALSRFTCICSSPHLGMLMQVHRLSDPEEFPLSTPLHLALCNRREDVAKALITHGANWGRAVPDNHGVTGLMVMAGNSMLPLLDWLAVRVRSCQGQEQRDNTNGWGFADDRDDAGLRALDYVSLVPDGPVAAGIVRHLVGFGSDVLDGMANPTMFGSPVAPAFERDWEAIRERSGDIEASPFYNAMRLDNSAVLEELCKVIRGGQTRL